MRRISAESMNSVALLADHLRLTLPISDIHISVSGSALLVLVRNQTTGMWCHYAVDVMNPNMQRESATGGRSKGSTPSRSRSRSGRTRTTTKPVSK